MVIDEADHHCARRSIVEDQPGLRIFADRALRNAGYDVVVAFDGREALGMVEGGAVFDLFLVDVVMPQMRGDEFVRQLRSRAPSVKVLYLNAHSIDILEGDAMDTHDNFIEKPVSLNGLLDAVSLALFGHFRGPRDAA